MHRRAIVAALCSIMLFPDGGANGLTGDGGGGFRSCVQVHSLLMGRTVSGRLVSLGPGAIKLASAEGLARELPLGRLIKLTREYSAAISVA